MNFKAYNMTLTQKGFKKELEETFTFCLENDQLVKLGDGAFGIVYKVHNAEGREFAVKLYYREQENVQFPEENHVAKRFSREFSYVRIIREKQRTDSALQQLLISGIIEPLKATDEFTISPAYEQLFGENVATGKKIRVSNYALILPLYMGTLKDLLEGKNPFFARNHGAEQKHTGYDMLRKAPADLRILAMLPILETIITGLKFLYFGGFHHLDIKPANIFYRLGLDTIEFTLADMGYLDPNISYQYTIIMSDEHLKILLGTISYRSPEQVNHFDRCDAQVETDGHLVRLVITDPKFKNTFIRKGDLLFFSKSERREPYVIERIDIMSDPDQVIIETTQPKSGSIHPEARTQVEFRKVQGIKTDLFGIGAIALDMLTAGASPEGFYGKIKNSDHGDRSVEELIADFRNITLSQSEKVENKHIFQDLTFIGNSSAGEKMVKFILKCMLYNARETFSQQLDSEAEHLVFDLAKAELNTIRQDIMQKPSFKAEPQRLAYEMLINKNINATISEEDPGLSSYLDQLAKMPDELFYWRLAKGIKYLLALTSFIREKIYDAPREGSEASFFIECYPRNIYLLNGELNAYITFAGHEQQYIKHLSEDVVINNLNASYTDFFVPYQIAYMKREIELTPFHNTPDNKKYFYNLKSKTPIPIDLKTGDWVAKGGHVHSVVDVDPKLKIIVLSETIQTVADEGKEQGHSDKSVVDNELSSANSNIGLSEAPPKPSSNLTIEAIYYHRINRLAYYLEILATYVQHLIFSGQGTYNTKEIPRKIKLVRLGLLDSYQVRIPTDKKEDPLQRIYHALGKLYADLILSEHEDSFHQKYSQLALDDEREASREIIVQVAGRLKTITADIEESFFGAPQFITDRTFSDFDNEQLFRKSCRPEIIDSFNNEDLLFEQIMDNVIADGKFQLSDIWEKFKNKVSALLKTKKSA
jgi:serine/threonine protein kinase